MRNWLFRKLLFFNFLNQITFWKRPVRSCYFCQNRWVLSYFYILKDGNFFGHMLFYLKHIWFRNFIGRYICSMQEPYTYLFYFVSYCPLLGCNFCLETHRQYNYYHGNSNEFLWKFKGRYDTGKAIDRLFFGLGLAFCYLHFCVISGAFVVLCEGSDTIESPPIVRY